MKKNTTTKQQVSDEQRVVEATFELLHNPATPKPLFQAIADFVCDQSNALEEELLHMRPILSLILASAGPKGGDR